jgi:hypothetical protein
MEQHYADADRDAVDGGDDHLTLCASAEVLGVEARGTCWRCRLQKILEVVAGGEHAGAAGDDDAADIRIVLRLSMARASRDICPG